ncbi:uncharacterized protein L969DRAFT_22109 [Mixia osmundae IAM 14324]|nr:uncharacterized protein L969DRAFT_22109 [Mixia osmundae IAM 14324]KEI41461.1 hypothetical protein L969DRAFT_22109 [Mixia osmundae IAM 14324]
MVRSVPPKTAQMRRSSRTRTSTSKDDEVAKVTQAKVSKASTEAGHARRQSARQTEAAEEARDVEEDSQDEEEDEEDEDDEQDEDFGAPAARKGQRKSAAASGQGQSSRKRLSNAGQTLSTRAPKTARIAAKGTARKSATQSKGASSTYRVDKDNSLYNALGNGKDALKTAAQNWLELYLRPAPSSRSNYEGEQGSAHAMSDFVNLALRLAQCNAKIDSHQVIDVDGASSLLDDIQEGVKQASSSTPLEAYPLVSKSKAFRTFRGDVKLLISDLLDAAHESEVIFDGAFLETTVIWLGLLASSPVRGFRHSATFLSMQMMTCFCSIITQIDVDADQQSRQHQSESRKSRADKTRTQKLAETIKALKDQKDFLVGYLDDLFDVVFVHRFRDSDASIRTECVVALGQWIDIYPSRFIDADYLRYVSWVLEDEDKGARSEAVKALAFVYSKDDFIGQIQPFTDRLKPRAMQMATCEADLTTQVNVIAVLLQMDSHGLLTQTQRQELAGLVFHGDRRVRKAAASFFASQVNERIESEDAMDAGDDATASLQLKAICALFVEISGGVLQETVTGTARLQEGAAEPSRLELALEALCDVLPVLVQWRSISAILLQDQSIQASSRTQHEETIMITTLLFCLGRVSKLSVKASDSEDASDDAVSMTRDMIDLVPKLLARYQATASRVALLLQAPRHLRLEAYSDLRMESQYKQLWDLVIRQFVSQSDSEVAESAISTIAALSAASTLQSINTVKLGDLEEQLINGLYSSVDGQNVETAQFSSDEALHLISALRRIALLSSLRDLNENLSQPTPGASSSAKSIIHSLADRGRLGFADDDEIVLQSLDILNKSVIWRLHEARSNSEQTALGVFREERDSLHNTLQTLSIAASTASETVKRSAFTKLVDLYSICAGITAATDGQLGALEATVALPCASKEQSRLALFLQNEISRHALSIDNAKDDVEASDHPSSRLTSLLRRHELHILVASYVRAVRIGAISTANVFPILPHLGRFDATFDHFCRLLINDMRDDGCRFSNGSDVASGIVDSLIAAFNLHGRDEIDEASLLAISRLLSSATLVRGSQLAISQQLPADDHIQIHARALAYLLGAVSECEQSSETERKLRLIAGLKGLAQLLTGVSGRAAMSIKTHYDRALRSANLIIPRSAKSWDALRNYEARLVSIMSKDADLRAAAKKTAAEAPVKSTKTATQLDEQNVAPATDASNAKSRPRPRPRPADTEDAGMPVADGKDLVVMDTPLALPEGSLEDSPTTSPSLKRRRIELDLSLPDEPLDLGDTSFQLEPMQSPPRSSIASERDGSPAPTQQSELSLSDVRAKRQKL